jgi:23S rRNA (uracil1939-C5)-methyltransferase
MSRRLLASQPAARPGVHRDLARNPPAALRPPGAPDRAPEVEDEEPDGHATPDAPTLEAKVAAVEALLGLRVDGVVPSPRQTGYRARILLRPGPDGRLGYTQPGSHRPAPLSSNPLARPELHALAAALGPLPGFAAVELRTDGERLVICASSTARAGNQRGRRGPEDRSTLARRLGAALDAMGEAGAGIGAAIDGRAVRGDPVLRPLVAGQRLRLGPNSFFQVNLELNALLVDAVHDRVRALRPSRLLDLYGGVGNLSLGLAKEGMGLTLIESAPGAVNDAQKVAEEWGLPAGQVDLRRGDAHRYRCGDAFFDVALLDPPRIGAGAVLTELALTRPATILYVSCNPHALARDLGLAAAAGYAPAELLAFDMFPGTPHLELLCALRPKP